MPLEAGMMRPPSPPSPQSPPSSLLPPTTPTSTTTTAPTSFEQTTRNLLRLGSLPMEQFAQDPDAEVDPFDVPLTDLGSINSASYPVATDGKADAEIPFVPPAEAVRFLRDAAQREFGANAGTDPLKYEHLADGTNRHSCILTVTRPGGLSRAYRTKAEFARRSDAKTAAASLAIQLGAVHFMRHGDAAGKRGLVLARLDVGSTRDEAAVKKEKEAQKEREEEEERNDGAVAQIETCCIEWRAGGVVPKWVHLADIKLPGGHGYALKVSLSNNIQRSYSVLPSAEHVTRTAAKSACARAALDEDVIEFIRHGDGLEQPIVVPTAGLEAVPPPPPPTVTTLQAFHDSLPQPLPDQVGIKANGEINAVGWLNGTIQMAKGSRLTTSYTWYTDAKLGLHGCLLRLSRPDGSAQSYLADAIFAKRADAKLAACLLACSQGVGKYIRDIMVEIDARVTPEMRRRATEIILPSLGQALNRHRHGSRPEFSYESDLAAFGCTLTVDLSPEGEKETARKLWTVPLAYKSKADAKFAVACLAADNGVLDFINNRGEGSAGGVRELEEGETLEGAVVAGKKKKRKKGTTAEGGGDDEAALLKKVRSSRRTDKEKLEREREPVFETREEAIAKGRFGPGPRGRGTGGGSRGRGAGQGPGAFVGSGRSGFGGSGHGAGFGRGFGVRPGARPPLPTGPMPMPQHIPPSHRFPHRHPPYARPEYDHSYPFDHAEAGPRHMHGAGRSTPPFHPPPPPPPRYAHYTDPYDYRSPPPFYGYDYPTLPPQRSYAAGAYHEARYPEHHQEHYAPDYDHIPDHPRHKSPPTGPRASYSRPPAPEAIYESARPQQANIDERLDIVISRLEKEADLKAAEEPPKREQSVPVKRGRASEQSEEPANKRARVRSKSVSGAKSTEGSKNVQPVEPLAPVSLESSLSPPPEKTSMMHTGEGASSKKRKGSEQREKSYVASLFDHCEKSDMPAPELCHEKVEDGYKVWIIMGQERLELPMSFETLGAGRERVAKSVLGRIKVQIKKKRKKEV